MKLFINDPEFQIILKLDKISRFSYILTYECVWVDDRFRGMISRPLTDYPPIIVYSRARQELRGFRSTALPHPPDFNFKLFVPGSLGDPPRIQNATYTAKEIESSALYTLFLKHNTATNLIKVL